MRYDYCHECESEEQTEITTKDTIELICDGCGHTEVLTRSKEPLKWGYLPIDGDDDPYINYGII